MAEVGDKEREFASGDDTEDERRCRICYAGGDFDDNGYLFRPCKCSGTMAWVHMECLDKWRKQSSNPRSFFKCDQCGYEYQFGKAFGAYDRLDLARLLSYRSTIFCISFLILFMGVFLSGFVYDLLFPPLEFDFDLDSIQYSASGTRGSLRNPYRGKAVEEQQKVEDLPTNEEVPSLEEPLPKSTYPSIFSLNHYLGGSIVIGFGSIFGWLMSVFHTGGFGPRFYFLDYGGHRGFNSRGGGGDAGKVILILIVVAGLFLALKWIYSKVKHSAERISINAAYIVLDIHRGGKIDIHKEPPAGDIGIA